MNKMKNKKHTQKHQEKEVSVKDQEEVVFNQHEKENQEVDAEKKEPKEAATTDNLQKELDEWKDKYVRLSAEFDNFRKRTLKEKIETTKIAGRDIFFAFLPIMDDFERAMSAMQETEDVEPVKEGLALIFTKCQSFLKQHNVKEIDAKGQLFDLELHDAVTKIPAPDESLKGKVIDVIQKGYLIDEKVLRYAKVVIGD